jgi:hypothetical protein
VFKNFITKQNFHLSCTVWSKTGKWDNGLYVTAFMKTVPVQFLVDSGSILTLISYNLFMKMCTDKELKTTKE